MKPSMRKCEYLCLRSLSLWLWGVGIFITTNFNITFAGNVVQEIDFSARPGDKVQIRFIMTKPAVVPESFFMDTQQKLVLDFFDTVTELPNNRITVGVGAVHDIVAVTEDNRTRIVIKFDKKIPYDLQARKNIVLLIVDSDLALAAKKTKQEPNPPSQSVGGAGVMADPQQPEEKPSGTGGTTVDPQGIEGQQIGPPVDTQTPTQGVQSIDFRRGQNGEGRVLIGFDRTDTMVSLQEEGQNIILEIPNTSLRPELRQKLDVVDFATPVQSITSDFKDGKVRISVRANGLYEYSAYQIDRLYTLEFSPKTPEEEERAKKERLVYTGERLSLNFQNVPVRTVLHLFGEFTERNMVISDAVQGNVTLRLKNVPWDQAMDIILKTKFLGKREHDNVTYIAPSADLIKQEQAELEAGRKVEELSPLRMELIALNYADADEIAAVLKSASKSSSTGTVDATSRDVTTADAMKPVSTSEGNETGNSLLSSRGSVTVHKQTNSLIVQDTAANLENIRVIITKLDVPVKQVMIEARVVIANNSFARNLGVRFGIGGSRTIRGDNIAYLSGSQLGYLKDSEGISGSNYNFGGEPTMVNLPLAANSGINLVISKLGSYLMQLELTALQQEGQGEVVSTPRVIASNRENAHIEQGIEIAYQEASSSGATSTAFKKAVLSLDVTPRITADSRISMILSVSKDSPNTAYTPPAVNTQSVRTTVLVDNGETIVLGGVYERNKANSRGSVPFFGGIPVLGHLFRNSVEGNSNTELLIFVTPKILRNDTASNTP